MKWLTRFWQQEIWRDQYQSSSQVTFPFFSRKQKKTNVLLHWTEAVAIISIVSMLKLSEEAGDVERSCKENLRMIPFMSKQFHKWWIASSTG